MSIVQETMVFRTALLGTDHVCARNADLDAYGREDSLLALTSAELPTRRRTRRRPASCMRDHMYDLVAGLEGTLEADPVQREIEPMERVARLSSALSIKRVLDSAGIPNPRKVFPEA